jgi:ActR/RegA family two-component response regulator
MNQQPVITTRKPSPSGKRTDEASGRPGRMVVCLGDLPHAAVIERYFQERGWKVEAAKSGAEVRLLVRKCPAPLVLLSERSNEESGWVTCWKVLSDRPKTRVCVIGPRPAAEGARFAEFVKAAAYIPQTESTAGIARYLKEAGSLD